MTKIDELNEIEEEEGKEYWRQSEMQAQLLAG